MITPADELAWNIITAVSKQTRKGFQCDGITFDGTAYHANIYTGLADPRSLIPKFKAAGAVVSRFHSRGGQWWEVRFEVGS